MYARYNYDIIDNNQVLFTIIYGFYENIWHNSIYEIKHLSYPTQNFNS